MASINQAIRARTYEGAPAYPQHKISYRQQLERSVLSCMLWEDTFYESGVSIADRIRDLVSKCTIEEVADVVREAKHGMKLRHAPLLLIRELARHKQAKKEVAALLKEVCTRPDDLTEFLAMYWQDKKQPLSKAVKQGLAEALLKFDQYQIAKYKNRGGAVKLRDVLRLTHPKPRSDEQSKLFKELSKGEVGAADTWEVALSAKGNNAESWGALLAEEKLGGLAVLRNLRNMLKVGVSNDVITKAIKGIKAEKLVPINFIAAAKYAPSHEPLLETKFFECFTSRKTLPGRTIVLVDVSGSMDDRLSAKSEMTRRDVASSLAMIAREVFTDVRVLTFSNTLVEVPARRGFALRDAIDKSQPHGGTELGKAVKELTSNPALTHDRLIVITDEQSQDRVPEVNGYMINVASNKHGVGYGKWLHIDGWSDRVIDYIVAYETVLTDEQRD